MNNRRSFLTAGTALAAMSALPKAKADQPRDQQRGVSIYLHGMVWNRQLGAPQNDWLIRLDAKADIPFGNVAPSAVPGFATLGDDYHDTLGSHVQFQTATLQGDQLTIAGTVTESKNPGLIGQAVRIEGKVAGDAVDGLTVTIGGSVFTGAGLIRLFLIAILIGL